MILTYQEG